MPRITRATVRSNAALENPDLAASFSLPIIPRKQRAPLGEIAGNAGENSSIADSSGQMTKARNKGSANSKKENAGKKAKAEFLASSENCHEILEDDNQGATSSAVEEACDDLMKHGSSGTFHFPHAVLADKDCDTLSPDTVQAMQHIGTEVSSQQHNTVTSNKFKEGTMKNEEEDSFIDAIRSRTPARLKDTRSDDGMIAAIRETGLADFKNAQYRGDSSGHEQGSEEDSFVGKIITRSPAKPMTRIEGSVEAIDAFEEEMEKIGELMPTISNTVSHMKTKTPKKNSTHIAVSKPKSFGAEKPTRSKAVAVSKMTVLKGVRQEIRQNSLSGSEVLAQAGKHSASKRAAPPNVKRVSSIHKAPFQPAKSTKPPTRPIFELPGDVIARKLKDKREERLRNENKRGNKKVEIKSVLKPIKSTKPLTHPIFELPGDAVARKLKEQRETRVKQQEADGEPVREAFKARLVRANQAPVVKSNATSKARMSLARESKESHRPASKRSASVSLGNANQRLSTLSVAKGTHAPIASPSPRTTRGPSLAATSSSHLSIAGPPQRITCNGNNAHQSVRGREVFERNKTSTEELERLRKEKEEAIKKARVEAAERGRLASRQWAEKQKARKIGAGKGIGRDVAPAEASI
ncbi:MAG: hypothetical protein Q9195_003927 [Heterodermia aff. obscurata]